MTETHYDVIVIGTGSMGSAACFHLASRGCRVLGLEQFSSVPHEQGAHAGQSRITRRAYFEHSNYVPLLNRAYENWQKLEESTGEQLYYKTGLLYCGLPGHEVIRGVKKAAADHHIELNPVSPEQQQLLFPSFRVPPDYEMVLEPDAGFLKPEKCISLMIGEAVKNGAVIKTGEKVLEWKRENGKIEVITGKDIFHAGKLVITAGAWAGRMAKQLNIPLKITRQSLIWVMPENPSLFEPERFPCWMVEARGIRGVYYGFPYLSGEKFPGPAGLKFALHYPDVETDPDRVEREISEKELQKIVEGIKDYFPAASGKIVACKTCLYANSPDEHFIIDQLPGTGGNVLIACGFSGHGFKFSSVIGEILADMTLDGKTALPVGFLGLNRFQ